MRILLLCVLAAEWLFILLIHRDLSNHFLADEHLGVFHLVAFIKKTTMNTVILVYICGHMFLFFSGKCLISEAEESLGRFMINFERS